MRHFQNSKPLVLAELGLSLALALTALAKPRPFKPARPQGATPSSVIGQAATLLPNGKLLLTGGEGPRGIAATELLRDPQSGITTPLPNALLVPRAWHSATLLPDGTVLIFGGVGAGGQIVRTAERLDPATGQSVPINTDLIPRAHHTATLLTDGRVFIAGGISDSTGPKALACP